ncbi:cytochrome-c peroxidase [Geomonas sp. RF6]|uniref:cytochrome-c peroxidase n=1 Tax=Geomonas sp. RF6 TaxID=2897342 RepID=UPI001E2968DF|nr:cytochrome-c peroxidase [Geomonas sp. RF6]UFS70528.1 cytochrome-c peroxidase [Geomonas sp. RF6]
MISGKGLSLRTALYLSLAGLVFASAASGNDDVLKKARAAFKQMPAKAPALKGNESTPARLELGKKLFFDPRLSASQLLSCNTCHNVGLGGVDLQETSIGHHWQKGPRNAPTVFNSVYNAAQFWDGRAEDLKAQAKGPVQAAVEMNNKPEQVVAMLKSIPGYRKLFREAFPREKDAVTFDNMARAIEVFEATLVTPDSPFDKYLAGKPKSLSAKEEEGLSLFMAKGCAACHGGINAGGSGYYPFGVVRAPSTEIRPSADTGRFKVTSTASDNYVFRSPALRNIALTAPYFHSGKVWRLEEAVAVMGSTQLGIQLDDPQTVAISAFLRALTGKQPVIEYPVLPPSSDATPHPVVQ